MSGCTVDFGFRFFYVYVIRDSIRWRKQIYAFIRLPVAYASMYSDCSVPSFACPVEEEISVGL